MAYLIYLYPLIVVLLLFLPALLISLALLRRDDLTNFQLWSLFLMSWFLPWVGPLTALVALKFIVPRR